MIPSSGRRSSRLSLAIPIIIKGVDASSQSFKENTWTISVGKYGAKLSTFHSLKMGSEILIENPLYGPVAKGRVVRTEERAYAEDPFEVSIELLGPPTVWGIKFPPEDWKQSSLPGSARQEGQPPSISLLPPATTGPALPAAAPLESPRPSSDGVTQGKEGSAARGGDAASPAPSDEGPTLPRAAVSPPDLEGVASRLESAWTNLQTLLTRIDEAPQKLQAEITGAEKRIREFGHEFSESILAEYRERLRRESENFTSSLADKTHQPLMEGWQPELQTLLEKAKEQLESLSKACLLDLAGQARERAEQGAQAIEQKFFHRLQEMAGEAQHDTREKLERALERSIKERVAQLGTTALERTEAELVNRESGFRAALAEMENRIREDLTTLHSEISESANAEGAKATAEISKRANASVEEGLRRLEEAFGEKQLAAKEETEQFKKHLSDLATTSHQSFIHYLEMLTDGLKSEFDQYLRTADEQAVLASRERFRQVSEELTGSAAQQLRQQVSEALVLSNEQIQRAGRGLLDDFGQQLAEKERQAWDTLDRNRQAASTEIGKLVANFGQQLTLSAHAAAESLDHRIQAANAEIAAGTEDRLRSAQDLVVRVQKQTEAKVESAVSALSQRATAMEAEYRRGLESAFSQSTENQIREFENSLAQAGQRRLGEAVSRLQGEIEATGLKAIEKIRAESEQAAKAATGTLHQGLGSAALILQQWGAEAAGRLEGVLRNSTAVSQQQMNAFLRAALEELQRGVARQLSGLHDRLSRAISLLDVSGPQAGPANPQRVSAEALEPAPDPEGKGPRGDRVQREFERLRDVSVDEAVRDLRAKLDEILKPLEQNSGQGAGD